MLLVWTSGSAQPPQRLKPPSPLYETRKDHDPDGTGKFYMGREIAQVMGHLAAGWLERPEREREEAPSRLIDALKLKPGDVVADIGAGSGYFSFRIAEKVGPKGKVQAVEIQQEMLDIIKRKMKQKNVQNIDLVLGTESDPKLPPESADLILMVDVYHEFSHPYEMMVNMLKGLKVGGRIVFVEYRLEDPQVPIKLVHKMTKKQVQKEMEPHAVKLAQMIDTLPWQHVIVFEKLKE
jgi:ubiquinone/menaquinone biosynthesis C-methylase UbiE